MIKVIIETDTMQEFDSLVEGYLTHKKRHEFKTVKDNTKSVIDRLENAVSNLQRDNQMLTSDLTAMKVKNMHLKEKLAQFQDVKVEEE